jgi:hypothetical protein
MRWTVYIFIKCFSCNNTHSSKQYSLSRLQDFLVSIQVVQIEALKPTRMLCKSLHVLLASMVSQEVFFATDQRQCQYNVKRCVAQSLRNMWT